MTKTKVEFVHVVSTSPDRIQFVVYRSRVDENDKMFFKNNKYTFDAHRAGYHNERLAASTKDCHAFVTEGRLWVAYM